MAGEVGDGKVKSRPMGTALHLLSPFYAEAFTRSFFCFVTVRQSW